MLTGLLTLLAAAGLTAGAIFYPPLGLLLLSAAKSALNWLSRRSLSEIICIALAITLVLTGYSRNHWKAVATQRQAQLVACENGRAQDRAGYIRAQAEAQSKNQAQVAHVKQQQQEITDATVSRLNARLELIRRELSQGGTPAPQSHPVSPGPGDPGPSPCRVIDPTWMCLSPADRLRAAENEERHDELIDWNLQQSAIDPNKP